MADGSVDIDQVALTVLHADGEDHVTGEYVLAAGHGWDDPADKLAYDRWQRDVLEAVQLFLAARRTGQPPPAVEAPRRPRGPELCGTTALHAEPVPLGATHLGGEEVTLFNAPEPVVELAMSIAERSGDLNEPELVAALHVWSAVPRGEWWSKFYGALVCPRVEHGLDDRGRRRATLRWTAIPWAGHIELPYGERVTLDVERAGCGLSSICADPPPAVRLPAITLG